VHAILIFTYGQLNPEFWPSRTTVGNIPGSVGYTFIILLALTSFRSTSRMLGAKAWKSLHVTGLWIIAGIFAFSNFKRIPMSAWYILPLGIMLLAMVIRILGKFAQTTKRGETVQQNRA
jgi:DMSO/TMAO reductase YedYZ heme-binding membrane subunit